MEHFKNATVRYIKDGEREIITQLKHIPLVIEPAESNSKLDPALFAAEHSKEILSELTKHGAVLLRGFNITSDKDFEQTVTSIKGIEAMPTYFMAEPGRTLVEGLQYVHYTNKIYKTGGTLSLGSFHTENYYSCDVPRFIVFCCISPSVFGGETGMIHMGNVYKSIDAGLKKKLEDKTFLVRLIDIKNIAREYSISEDRVKEICAGMDFTINTTDDGKEMMHLYKPSVLYHPVTNEPALCGNISTEIKGLDAALRKLVAKDYSGIKWVIHKLLWRYPNLINPRQMKKDLVKRLRGRKEMNIPTPAPIPDMKFSKERLGSVFTKEDIAALAKALKEN